MIEDHMPNLVYEKLAKPAGNASSDTTMLRASARSIGPAVWPFFSSRRQTYSVGVVPGMSSANEWHCAHAAAYRYSPASHTPYPTGFAWAANGHHILHHNLPVFRMAVPLVWEDPPNLTELFCVTSTRLWVPPYGEVKLRKNRRMVAEIEALGLQLRDDVWMLASLSNVAQSRMPSASSLQTLRSVSTMLTVTRAGGSLDAAIGAAMRVYERTVDDAAIMRLATDLSYVFDGHTGALMFWLGAHVLMRSDGQPLLTLSDEIKWGMEDLDAKR